MYRKTKLVYALVGLIVIALVMIGGCSTTQQAPKPADNSQKSAGTPAAPAPAPAPAPKPYFEGKTITIIVPNSPGGSHDTGARIYAPFIKKYTGAANVVVVNKPGAGSILGQNELWTSPGDGSVIMFTSVITGLLGQAAEMEGMKFDPTKFTYLARAITKPRILTIGKKSNIKNVDELKDMNRDFNYPAVGIDDDFYTMAVVADSLGLKLKTITGFGGEAECLVSVNQGNADGLFTIVKNVRDMIKAGEVVPIMVLSEKRLDEFPDVPTALEVTSGQPLEAMKAIVTISEMYESFFAPPNMDKEPTEVLREAVGKAINDPEAKALVEKTGGTVVFMEGGEVQKTMTELAKSLVDFKPILSAAAQSVK